MTSTETLLCLSLLFTKHFVVDFPLQKPYQYLNKGTYGHPGGILHASLHGLGTIAALWMFTNLQMVLLLGFMDAIIHYHIDWAKMKMNKVFGWGATTHEQFWWLLGLDQYLHAMTYILLVALL
jgi:hypothetical protein